MELEWDQRGQARRSRSARQRSPWSPPLQLWPQRCRIANKLSLGSRNSTCALAWPGTCALPSSWRRVRNNGRSGRMRRRVDAWAGRAGAGSCWQPQRGQLLRYSEQALGEPRWSRLRRHREERTMHRKMLRYVHAFPCEIAIQPTVPASVPIIRSDSSRTDEPLARAPYSVFSK